MSNCTVCKTPMIQLSTAHDDVPEVMCPKCGTRHENVGNLDELSSVERNYRRAQLHAETLRETRNELISLALADGWTHAAISEATGLTRGRIGQLAMRD